MRCCEGCRLLQSGLACARCGSRTWEHGERAGGLFGPSPVGARLALAGLPGIGIVLSCVIGGVVVCNFVVPGSYFWPASTAWAASILGISAMLTLSPAIALRPVPLPRRAS